MNITLNRHADTKMLAYLVPLLFVFMPRPAVNGAQFLTYPVLGGILSILILVTVKKFVKSESLMAVTLLLFLYMISVSISVLMSVNPQFTSIAHIFKPVLFVIVLFFGYIIGQSYDVEIIEKSLVKASKVIMASQLLVGIPQLLAITIFDSIYNAELARPIGSLIRIVGTLGNPNIFAWVVIISTVTIFLMEKSKLSIVLWVAFGAILIILSGSRTSFALFPAVLFVCTFLKTKKTKSFYFFKVPMYLFALFLTFQLMVWLITKYQQTFPYLSQLLQILETGELTSVSSFNMRTLIWSNAWNVMVNENRNLAYLFGLGPNFSASTFIDNDFLYSILNYGFIGLLLNLSIYITVFIIFSKLKNRNMKVLGQTYVIFSILIGIQAETISGWNYPILIMFYLGLAIALKDTGKDYNGKPIKSNNKKKRLTPRITW
ncbi:O-antigen ligase family protein [Exiguobacterium mexicanum]|uniref:O-antigen ligase family protein n=1 Tax=Exiguobacterium mexicanum TaxID=340146 RepID=UPI00110D6A8B|nr:hypothetical protein [Exiguobacterium mexicanum]